MRKSKQIAILTGLAAGVVLAQPGGPMPPAAGPAQDPPTRVARLNYLNGPVSFRPGSVDDWTAATLNYPLVTGDHLWTDAGAQSEMHIGSTAIRMDQQTAMSVLNLNDQVAQISLTQGALEVRIRNLGENETFEVDTPNVAISLLRPGEYRINADGDNNVTIASVRAGEAEVTAGGAAFPLHAGQSGRLAGMDTVSQDIGPLGPMDGFDQWCQQRDQRENASVSARYVPREMIGCEDLDHYGVWTEIPPYGPVWRPTAVPAGWAPYHYGHWAWVAPYGWTWIDDAAWGFAPFHYGRWAFVAGAWYWVPGRMMPGMRPVYAPALVAFVGGGGFAVGIGGGGMAAWFPLGPGEVYRPAYAVSAVYVQNLNVMHAGNVAIVERGNVRYVNQGVAGAVMVVPHDAFVTGRPMAAAAVMVPRETIMRASVIGPTAQFAPVRESVLERPGGGVVVRTPPARFVDRTVMVRNTPPPPPVSFAAQQRALQANGGRPLDAQQIREVRASAPAPRPMVREAGAPAGPAGNPRPAAGAPRNDRPMMQNDRPPSARPQSYGQPQEARPAQQETRPVQQQARPEATPAARGNAPETRNEPAAEKKTEKKTEKKNEKKAPPKKEEKKGGL